MLSISDSFIFSALIVYSIYELYSTSDNIHEKKTMNILSSLMLISLSIAYVFSFNHQRLENDHMCQITSGILCVPDELKIIAAFAEGILNKANEIEAKVGINFKNNTY